MRGRESPIIFSTIFVLFLMFHVTQHHFVVGYASRMLLTLALPDDVSRYDLRALERAAMQAALAETNGNQAEASKLLGITKRVMDYKMKTRGLPRPIADRRRNARLAADERANLDLPNGR